MKMKGQYLIYLMIILIVVAMVAPAYATGKEEVEDTAKYYEAADKYGKTALAKELYRWYADAAAPYRGKTVKTILEKLPPTEYLANTIAPMFMEITGIKVITEMGSNEEVYSKEMLEATSRSGTYDFFYDDQDMIGTWNKRKSIANLTQLMKDHPELVEPELDLDDFIDAVINMYTDKEGNLWNLPMEQYPKVYLYRSDLLEDPREKAAFRRKYGWDLRPAKTYDEYTDIAEFFTRPEDNLYGHACAGKRHPALAYEWTEALFLQAGVCSPGIPCGRPINGWGIEINSNEQMAGCSVKTGGTINSPKMKEFFVMYKNLIDNFAPPGILEYIWEEEFEAFNAGRVVQIPNYYSQLIPPLAGGDSTVVGKFKVTMPPVTKHWKDSMARGYWDSAGFIIPAASKSVEPSWLFAQFVVSKAHELERAKNVGCTVRKSILASPELSETDKKLGGLISLMKSPEGRSYTGTDPTIEEYAAMLEIIYSDIHRGLTGEWSPEETLDNLAEELDTELSRMGYPIK
ncbi:MAG: extracellular solute-binding protein [Spirochaetes bacterium]|nr:extracellular solute-binding protein [Spirochaetota bacterium]